MRRNRKARKQYFVDKPFQLGFIKKISVLAIVFVAVSLIVFAVVYHLYGGVAVSGIDPLYDASTSTVEKLARQATVFDLLWPVLGVTLCVILLVTFLYGMVLSHRMAGPLYRMRLDLQQLLIGTPRPDRSLRANDEFKNLYEEMNKVKGRHRALVASLHRAVNALDADNPQKARKELVSVLFPNDDASRDA
ncbi:hypothetical protein GO013_07445 [Pseudodesulfovibrio sp. JC047]|uniref:hypothetical protein n=1 Tax=Pseudodesulfovibrio sp. JC047 TaxID=2683199 RepID=UPI0013CFB46B|nr:hypothetical protein [Pseudodesulfovibrio sp. JC047]NDV19253.1 hypothetical protein [Pseudodesulfovibrio sp. JC047]